MAEVEEIEVTLKLSRFSARAQIEANGEAVVVADALRQLATQIESGKGFGIASLQSDPLAQVGFFRVMDRVTVDGETFLNLPGVWGQ